MNIKLANSKSVLQIQSQRPVPSDGWKIIEIKGKRKVIRKINSNGHKTVENLIRYIDKDSLIKYQESLLGIQISRKGKQRMGDNRYIYESGNKFLVKVGPKYLGRFEQLSEAKKRRDLYIKETAQSIQL